MSRFVAFRRSLALSGLLLVPCVVAARPAEAFHLHLKRAEPGINDTVAVAPKVIRLWFTERPEAAVARIQLQGPGGGWVAVAKPYLEPGDDAPLAAAVTGAMAPGAYRVLWRAMAADGHPMRGSFGFVLKPAS
ncbi:MAG TPA: copper resistance CopC family protein [Gemmatimonadales bacterium]|nr:copper resistance CopC family protein [Gemmatimonadales bacterium]